MALADILPSLLDSVSGMSVEDVQAQIEASPVASSIADPAALAAMLVKASADPAYADTLMGGTVSAPESDEPPNPG